MDLEVEEKNILTVPMYHIAGIQAVMAAVYGGRTLVLQRQFDPEEWMQLVQQHAVDRAMMVPTMIKQLMDHEKFEEYNLTSLQVITYGAAPMPLEVIKRAIERFPGTHFINAFGQTESAATITMLGPEDHIIEGTEEEKEVKLKRLGSIGKPLPDVEVRIMDENASLLPPGEVGEIVARGERIMKGYWKQEDATSATIDREGWLHTGDLGYADEAGYIFLAGRAKDIIKRGGEMISPEELENIILAHPKIEDVAIIGVPDQEWGRARACGRRAGRRGRQAVAGRDRGPGALPHRQLQEAGVGGVHRRAAPEPDGQDPEAGPAGAVPRADHLVSGGRRSRPTRRTRGRRPRRVVCRR